jgi:CHASE3 domain sensor protein/two-component sensor histidine kinase
MHYNLSKKIDILFFIIIIILAGLFYTILQSTRYTRKSSDLVSQTQAFLYNLEKVESSVTDVETAHRGFVISGNEVFLKPIEGATVELSTSLNKLENLSASDSAQKGKITYLKKLVDKKLQISNEAIALRRNEEPTVALRFIASEKGRHTMDSIRLLGKEIERDQISSLNKITNSYEEHIVKQNTYFVIFTGFILFIIFLFYLRIRSNAKQIVGFSKKQNDLINALNSQNKQLDDFAHLTSHNIRSPAINIFSLISLINEKSTIEDYKFIFEKLTKVSRNLNETLNELIEVLHVKNNSDIEKQELAFQEVYDKVKESLQGEILLNSAKISTSFTHPVIEYPKAYLESIFHNLLSNAIKYKSPERPLSIYVETEKVNGRIQLKVTDNGLGIDLHKYGKLVFGLRKTFHRTENSKGIGLFMTKTQIEALGGEILVESEVNKGSTFKVTF